MRHMILVSISFIEMSTNICHSKLMNNIDKVKYNSYFGLKEPKRKNK